MRAFIHIGGHKTGSTYLQDRLRASKSMLADCGLEYPALGPSRPGHHGLAGELKTGEPGPELAMLREASVSSPRDLIVSSENFENLDAGSVKLLAGCLENRELHVIYYLRSWADICYGSWQEGVKHGKMIRNYPEFLLEHVIAPQRSAMLDYRIRLAPWIECLGLSALTVIPYEMVPRGQLFRSLLLGATSNVPTQVDLPSVKRANRRNRRLTPETAELLRILNTFAKRDGLIEPKTRILGQLGSSDLRVRKLRTELVAAMKASRERVPDVNESPAALDFFTGFLEDFDDQIPAGLRTDAQSYLGIKRQPVVVVSSSYLLDAQARANCEELWSLIEHKLRRGDEVAERYPRAVAWKSRFRAGLRSRRP